MRENTWYVSIDTMLLRMIIRLEYVIDVVDPFHNSRISGILAPIRTGGAAP